MLRAALALADVLSAHRAAAVRGARGPLSVRAFWAAVASAGYDDYAIGALPHAGPHARAPTQQLRHYSSGGGGAGSSSRACARPAPRLAVAACGLHAQRRACVRTQPLWDPRPRQRCGAMAQTAPRDA